MEVSELVPGLWRWIARHPEWTPRDAADWDPEVGCVYAETPAGIVLIDPLVPGGAVERERFWRALDRDVARVGCAPYTLLTVWCHARSAAAILDRYDGARVWAEQGGRALGPRPAPVTDTFRAGQEVAGVASFAARSFSEVVYWLPGYRAVVAGDVLLGDGAGGVRVCPDSWLEGSTPEEVRAALGRLLELPVERVLVSHGEPVLAGGREALARALA